MNHEHTSSIFEPIKKTALNAYRRILQTLSILAVVMALIAIILASYGEYITVKLFKSQVEYYMNVSLIAVILYIIVAVIMVAINFKFLSNKKHESLLKKIDSYQEKCKQHEVFLSGMEEQNKKYLQALTKTLSSSWANTKFAECFILNDQVDLIESSVINNGTIYIFTSDFALEIEENNTSGRNFIDIIIRNFQKGVTYKYIIPDTPSSKKEFNMITKTWFKKLIKPIYDKQICNSLIETAPKVLSDKMNDILNKNIKNQNPDNEFLKSQEKEIKELFIKQLFVYAIDIKYFYTTCALYQDGNGNTENAFIKLPSGEKEGVYVAFKIIADFDEQRKDFIRKIEDFCEEEKRYFLPDNVFDFVEDEL